MIEIIRSGDWIQIIKRDEEKVTTLAQILSLVPQSTIDKIFSLFIEEYGDNNYTETGAKLHQQDSIQNFQRMLEMARKSLQILETQTAQFNSSNIPTPLRQKLEEQKRKVKELERRLEGL